MEDKGKSKKLRKENTIFPAPSINKRQNPMGK
jgi:hypothetical protein